jgi:hypothetical protein
MRIYIAAVVVPSCAIVVSAVTAALVCRAGSAPRAVRAGDVSEATSTAGRAPVGPDAVSSPPSRPGSPIPPTVQYERPVGGEFFESWGKRLAIRHDGPPPLFLVSSAELNDERYGWEMRMLARTMAEELSAVLEKGCRNGCDAQAGRARVLLQELVEAEARRDSPAQTRHWKGDGDDSRPVDHREIAIRTSAGQVSLEVVCRCESVTIGMGMWNDVTTCDASLLDRGRRLLRYSPRLELGDDRTSLLVALDAYQQTVRFFDGEQLIIESGHDYTLKDPESWRRYKVRELKKAGVRGSVRWSKAE